MAGKPVLDESRGVLRSCGIEHHTLVGWILSTFAALRQSLLSAGQELWKAIAARDAVPRVINSAKPKLQ